MKMRVQRTRTIQLRAPLTATLGMGIRKLCSAILTHVRSIIKLDYIRNTLTLNLYA